MKIVYVFILFSISFCLDGQSTSYSYYYRVYFSNKGNNNTGNFLPEELLSVRAISRRQKAGISLLDYRDIPVFKGYLDQISLLGLKLHSVSKWMNTALFKTQSVIDINTILNLSFVSDVRIVKTPGGKSQFYDKLDLLFQESDPPPFDRPVTMVNGSSLHNSGYNGKGVLIAVLDGGFTNTDQISSLKSLRDRIGIKATFNFVENNEFVYGFHNHGTAVLSVLAGELPGLIEGTAPGADYILLRTEDGSSEFPCEEDFWAAGAEFADSSGADIISSSLGYFSFDNAMMNYKYSDLDGNSSFVTMVADIAASKGILVINSAGNERNRAWKRIIFPADGDSVLAIGAVDGNNLISDFSSSGPSADGRIKPDNVTMGVSVPVQTNLYTVERSSGTSFSCPVLSGMAACLMQAVPEALNTDLIEALHSSADKYNSPDSLFGYGIPNMVDALIKLQGLFVNTPEKETIAGPNPTSGNIEIIFRTAPENFIMEIISITGDKLFKKEYRQYAGRTLLTTELQNREPGLYFIRIIIGADVEVHKVIKLKN